MGTSNNLGLIHAFIANDEAYIMLGDGLRRAVDRLAHPDTEVPAFVVCIGRGLSMKLWGGRHAHPLAEVQVNRLSENHSQAMFMVSVDLEHLYSRFPLRKYDHLPYSHRVAWAGRSTDLDTDTTIDTVLGRLVLPFSDVICLFLDDFGSTGEAIDIITRWSRIMASTKTSWKPTLLLASRKSPITIDHEKISFFTVISSVQVSDCRSKGFQSSVLQAVAPVHEQRTVSRSLFSARHLMGFFKGAMKHLAQGLNHFDFVTATRTLNPVGPSLSTHVRTFLELCRQNEVSKEFSFRYISSALVMDSCPPGMHYFNGEAVFDSLYATHCSEALAQAGFSPEDSCELIRAKFCRFYGLVQPGCAAKNHQEVIRSFEIDWTGFRTTRSCLVCLRRKPEHSFRCGHTLCDECVRIFGSQLEERESAYILASCLICPVDNKLIVDLKPPTAGARLLVLDGGGIRGIFSILAIRALDAVRRLPYPIYDDFDLAMGTSSGGLIILMMFLRQTMSKCLSLFETLATRVFCRQQNGFLSWLYGTISSLVTDSRYGSYEIERCIKEVYGKDTRLFNGIGHESCKSGTKFGVTAMTVSTSQLCILSSYNGEGARKGYLHHRPVRIDEEVRVWEAARATSAAPSYFPAKFIRGLGFTQDGGAGKYNNPIDPAEWEAKAVWKTASDVVVSIGTGYTQTPQPSPVISDRLRLRDRFLVRLLRILFQVIDPQSSWEEHFNRQAEDDREKNHRVNMALAQAPELDASDELPRLKRLSSLFLEQFDFRPVVQKLLAASFFLVLQGMPESVAGHTKLRCIGTIRCRSPDSHALINRVLDEYPAAYFSLDRRENLGEIARRNLCKSCGKYSKAVSFNVHDMERPVNVYLHFNTLWNCRISGFPQSVVSLIHKQSLEADFGRSDHGPKQSRGCCSFPRGKHCQSRKRSLPSDRSSRKRIRL